MSSLNPFHPDNMSRSTPLSRVLVQSNVLHILLAHALSTEKEEIMGMLMGDWIKEGNTEFARVDGVSLLTRSEKRKDRVEIGPEQLTMAAIEAEYHSHPHITVFPSHVDLRTQLSQQLMDSRFIGMIVSCFNTDNEMSNKIQVTCFQSKTDDSGCQHIKLPFSVLNENLLDSLTLPKLLEISERIFDEQRQSFYKSIPLTSRPKATTNNSTGTDRSSKSMSESPTELFAFSKDADGDVDMSSEGESTISTTTRVPSFRGSGGGGSVDDIPPEELSSKLINTNTMSLPDRMTLVRNSGVYIQSLSSLVDNLVGPTLQMLVDREQYNQSMLKSLRMQKHALLQQLNSPSTLIDLVDLSDE
ncbi:BRCA1 BRCA2-containing complex, subunit 3 [Gryganskiella cystojenkinii]|nr:BRCA1 BRCA2-containing complex, subunit 3 [Gryganskiella cystojenkinii]